MSSHLSEIRRLLALYAQRVDDRNVEGLVALFAEDAQLETSDGVYKGHSKIREWFADYFARQLPGSMEQHQAHNLVMTINDDGETGEVRTDILCFRSLETTPWELGVVERHHDRLAKVKGEWYFSEKAIEIRGGFKRTANPVADPVSID